MTGKGDSGVREPLSPSKEGTDSGDRIERSRLKHVAMSGLYGRNSEQGTW